MRSFQNLFSFKKTYYLDIIRIGYDLIIITEYDNFKQIKPLIDYVKIKNGLIFLVNKIKEIYDIESLVFETNQIFLFILIKK